MDSYSVKIVRLNTEANQELLGVQLGRLCISNNVSVNQVAKDLDVTKAAVYRWFAGKVDISKHLREKVHAYYRSIPPQQQAS
jgi:transcriptional regulator with XRE-family HTH domain